MNRRNFLQSSLGASLAAVAATGNIPVIDTHIHLFDVSRKQGVPWPPKDSPIYKTALPGRYRKLAVPHGVVGAIEIECSPWFDDNQWVLDVAQKDPIIVGTVGDLEPGTAGFAKQLEGLHKNPLFRGIRYGNIWDRDLGKKIAEPAFVEDLKRLASAGLVLDTANATPSLMRAAAQVIERVPNLTVILDHMPGLALPNEAAARKACEADLQSLAHSPRVFIKISAIVRKVDGRVPLDLPFYRDRLDHLWETFGPDKLMYGSDWPNGDQWAQYPDVFRLAQEFISAKDHLTKEKFFWRTSAKAYQWIKRDPSQPAA